MANLNIDRSNMIVRGAGEYRYDDFAKNLPVQITFRRGGGYRWDWKNVADGFQRYLWVLNGPLVTYLSFEGQLLQEGHAPLTKAIKLNGSVRYFRPPKRIEPEYHKLYVHALQLNRSIEWLCKPTTAQLCIKILETNRTIKVVELDRDKETKEVLEEMDALVLRNNGKKAARLPKEVPPKSSTAPTKGTEPTANALNTEVGKLLKAEGLERAAQVLYDEEVYTKEAAQSLTEEDYASLGIKIGTKRLLIKLFKKE